MPMSAPAWPYFSKAFKSSAGWMDATSESIIAGGDADPVRIQALAKELVGLQPDVLVAHSTPSAKGLLQATRSIPIVFLTVTDPLGQGLVASLSHPGGNITGFSVFEFSLGTKWVEVLKQIAPGTRRVTAIFNPETAPYYGMYLRSIEAATSAIAVELIAVQVHSEDDISNIIRKVGSEPNGGLFVLPDSHNVVHRKRIIELSAQYRLPAIYYFRYFASIAIGRKVRKNYCQDSVSRTVACRISNRHRIDHRWWTPATAATLTVGKAAPNADPIS